MKFDTIIRNGIVVTATDTYPSDVGISGDKISAIAAQLPIEGASKVIDAAGRYVLPGGIDVHTHLDMPFGGTTSADDFESGTIAAAHGGTTCLIDFAIQYRGQTMRHALDEWMKKAQGKAAIDYGFHMIATDLPPDQLGEMAAIVREGVTSFKLFMAYPGVLLLDDQSIFRAMLRAGELGALITMHAETGLPIDVRSDVFSAAVIVYELTLGRRLFSHLPDLEAMRAVRECKVPRPREVDPSLPEALDEHAPQLLLLCIGGNDFLRRTGNAQAEQNVRAMVKLARNRGIGVLLIGTPEPGLLVWSLQEPRYGWYPYLMTIDAINVMPGFFGGGFAPYWSNEGSPQRLIAVDVTEPEAEAQRSRVADAVPPEVSGRGHRVVERCGGVDHRGTPGTSSGPSSALESTISGSAAAGMRSASSSASFQPRPSRS